MAVDMTLVQLIVSIVAGSIAYALAKSGKSIWLPIFGFILGSIIGWIAGFLLGMAFFKGHSVGVQMRAMGSSLWTALLFSGIGVFQGRRKIKSGRASHKVMESMPEVAAVAGTTKLATSNPPSVQMNSSMEIPHTMPTPSKPFSPPISSAPLDIADENYFYGIVANELDTGNTDKGLWTRLYAEHDGDETKTKIAYIKQRVGKLLALESQRIEAAKQEDFRAETEKLELLAKERFNTKDRHRDSVLPKLSRSVEFDKIVDRIRRSNEDPDLLQRLMEEPLWAEAIDSNGNTLLHFAVRNQNERAVRTLIEYGADKDYRNNRGVTPRSEADSLGRSAVLDLFK